MVLNNSELFPTVWDEAVDLAKNYNVEIPPIGGAVNNVLQAQKLLENFQLSDGKAAGDLGDRTSIDNFLINGQQGYSTSLSNQNSSPGDTEALTGIQQQESRSFISSLDVGPDGRTYCSCEFCTQNLEGDLFNINLSDSLDDIKQGSSPSSSESEIADSLSGEANGSGGGGNAFTSIPRPLINQQFPPATINVTYNGLPPQAQAAFDYAVDIWENLISSPVPITIQVNWALPISAQNLARATTLFTSGSSNVPNGVPNTSYPLALANRLAGSDLFPNDPDFTINFNNSRTDWYFGTNAQTSANQFDFVSVALHELAHGLGFSGRMNVVGGQGRWGYLSTGVATGVPTIYDRLTINGSGQSLIDTSLFPNPSTALATQLTSNSVFFNGANATIANGNNNPKLFAPNPWVDNSSYAHFDESTYPAGNRNSLMTPNLNPAEAVHNPGSVTLGLLKDLGWAVNSLNRVKTFRDFDGDKKADTLWRDPVSGSNFIRLMNGINSGSNGTSFQLGTSWQAQGTGDFDGNGKADILWRDPVSGWNSVWLMDGTAPTGATGVFQIGTNWQVHGINDFDGNGKADILLRDPATGWNSVWLMDGTAPTGATGVFQLGTGTSWQTQGTGDFDGNGKADILWRDPVSGWHSVWLMDGTAPTGATTVFQLGTNWQVQGIDDFNGDKKADIFWRDPVSGSNLIRLMNGINPGSNGTSFQLGASWQAQGTGDFDGNGKADILWRDPISGTNSVWLMDGTAPTGATATFPLGTNWEAVG